MAVAEPRLTGAPATIRAAMAADAPGIAAIYNQGIVERQATFETRPRTHDEVAAWLDDDVVVLVAERDGRVAGFARAGRYSDRCVYAGVGEHGVYVDRAERGRGTGRALLEALATAAEERGLYKLTSRVFTTNAASLALHRAAGFEVAGIQRRHGRLDGEWKDCALVERLLGEAAR
ncbi:MAG TPA: arsinothricin resistance N-acetyltransferase ArsN1 family A [Solirubrobacteraceae bacterium]|nr:arsinothricin resistance N-acetyltransferase ArsN1 family A [Solirubrobacteraceae bacterium]